MDYIIKSEKFLRQKSESVESEKEANAIIKELKGKINDGVGLSAPQIGILKKVAIVRYKDIFVKIVNPFDIELSEEKFIFKEEGCLSFPGIRKNTLRQRVIQFKNEFEDGVHCYSIYDYDSMFVVTFQHEIDHFNGILFFDYQINTNKVGRNDLCLCGSEKKYKRCCLKM